MSVRGQLRQAFLVDQIEEARRAARARPNSVAVERAEAAIMAADRALDMMGMHKGEGAQFVALGLYRSAITLLTTSSGSATPEASGVADEEWRQIQPLLDGTPADDATRAHADVLLAAAQLRPIAHALLSRAIAPEARVARMLASRTRRVALAVLLAGLTVFGIGRMVRKKSVLEGRPWVTSSSLAECQPRLRRCGGAETVIFFHTIDEPSPWIRFDLGERQTFRSLEVKNRSDYGPERAIPLVLEASDDAKVWRELARKEERFATWRATLPETTARYVRLRVDRKSILHLETIALYR